MTKKSLSEDSVTNTLTAEDEAPASSESPSLLSLEPMLTSRNVCELLQIEPHTLSTNRKAWSDILPPIRFKGSNLIRYRRSDVQRLLEGGYTPAPTPSSEGEGEHHGHL